MQNKPKSLSLQKLERLPSQNVLKQPQKILDQFFITQQVHNRNSLLKTTRSLVKLKGHLDVQQQMSSQRGEMSKRLRFSVREKTKKVSQMRQIISQNISHVYELQDRFDKLSTKLELVKHDQATLLHIVRRSQIENDRHLQLIKAKLQLILQLKVSLFKSARQLRQTVNEQREREREVQQLKEEQKSNRETQEEYKSTIGQIIRKNETELQMKQVHDHQYFIKREATRLQENTAIRKKWLAGKLASSVLQFRLNSLAFSAREMEHQAQVMKIKGKVKEVRQLLPKYNQEKATKVDLQNSIAKRQRRLLELQEVNRALKQKIQQLTLHQLQLSQTEERDEREQCKERRLERVEWRASVLERRVGVGSAGELSERLKRIFCIVRQELQ